MSYTRAGEISAGATVRGRKRPREECPLSPLGELSMYPKKLMGNINKEGIELWDVCFSQPDCWHKIFCSTYN
jgi:hypothetical protein